MKEHFLETQGALVEHWQISPVSDSEEKLNYELLLEALRERILYLLHNNMEKLYTAVYLLDISETRFNQAMSAPRLEEKAQALAECILKRETEKIAIRSKYPPPKRDYVEYDPQVEPDNTDYPQGDSSDDN